MDAIKLKKSHGLRDKKERKTILDGNDILKSIGEALRGGKSAYGFTMGNVSLIQIVEFICQEFGGGFELATCIWSANHVDIQRLAVLKKKGLISSAKFLIDPSAYTRKYDAVEMIYKTFGIESVRSVPTHAKFVTLVSDKHEIAITSSMNFTHNPRIEQYEVVECSETCELMIGMVNTAFEKYGSDENFTGQALTKFTQIKKSISKKSDFDLGLDLDLDW